MFQPLVSGIKLYRKLRYRKGHGVHSPFVYNFITKIVEEKATFYAFDEIEKCRREILSQKNDLSILTAKETQSTKYGALLFRIVNFFRCQTVLQIGGSTGIMSLYLAMASKHCDCFALEERQNLLNTIRDFALAHNLNKLHCVEGDAKEALIKLQSVSTKTDLIFINQLPASISTEELLSLCQSLRHKETIMIINEIMRNKSMKKLWMTMRSHPQTRVSIDLFALGILFFDDRLPKKHYKTHFNNGKKQNIHTNRRRRLYLSGRWKKSFKNKSKNRSLRHG